jgi:hypothetical protein
VNKNTLIVILASVGIAADTAVALVAGGNAATVFGALIMTIIGVVAGKLYSGGGNANPPAEGGNGQ